MLSVVCSPMVMFLRFLVLLLYVASTSAFAPLKALSLRQSLKPLQGNVEIPQEPEECFLDENGASECLSTAGYVRDTSSFATVTEVFVAEVESLRDDFESFEKEGDESTNSIKFNRRNGGGGHMLASEEEDESPLRADIEYNELIGDRELVLVDTVRKPGMSSVSRAFRRAGPRKYLHFDPTKVNAAIVTAGGLCPGLNNVIRELVHALYYLYDANAVYGIVGGFHGFYKPEYKPVKLTPKMVDDINHEGGTVLRSSRGGFDIDKIITFLQDRGISQLYVIGGDGTHRGAYAIHTECRARGLNIAVAGIPKTIDNDIDFIDRSFGFQSAVEAAQSAIETAKTEAKCTVPNSLGICKLMGRSAGFLAAFAALGSGDVDLVLLPEVPIIMDGPNGILPFLRKRVKEKRYALVVLAEGAGEELVGISGELDKGGNKAKPMIAEYLQKEFVKYFESFGEEATLKYVDPSYMVRSVPANGADSLYCMQLAQNAVHGAMAGYTGFSVGMVNRNTVYLPIPQLVATSPRSMDPYGQTWEAILSMTGQPNTVPPKESLIKGDTVSETLADFEIGLPEPTAH